MRGVDRFLGEPRVEGDGAAPPEDDNRMGYMFIFLTEHFRVWFVSKLRFLENGNDYVVEIVDFGRLKRLSTDYMTFDSAAVENIKKLLQSYFLGNNSKFAKMPGPKSTCHGVHFHDGWIRETTPPSRQSAVRWLFKHLPWVTARNDDLDV